MTELNPAWYAQVRRYRREENKARLYAFLLAVIGAAVLGIIILV